MGETTKKIKLSDGYEVELDLTFIDDMELLDVLTELQENTENRGKAIQLMPKVLKKFLGEEERKKLYDHFRTESGRVPISSIEGALAEIFSGIDDSKKN